MIKRHRICPIFIPHLGCPYTCVFCNQHKITGQSLPLPPKKVRETFLTWQKASPQTRCLAYYGGSFTALPDALQEAYLKEAKQLKEEGYIDEIRLSTRPDKLEEARLDVLQAFGVDTVEIGFQSLDQEVLANNQRGHDHQVGLLAVKRLLERGFLVGGQMMLGLYKDEPQKSIETARQLAQSGIAMVRLYPTVVLKDTALARLYDEGKYVPWSRDCLLDTLAKCMAYFIDHEVAMIRIGLQDELHLADEIVAGYYHPALGELAYGRLFRQKMEKLAPLFPNKEWQFQIHPKAFSKAVGHKGENKAYFSKKYGVSLYFKPDETLSEWEVRSCI